jgi:hypothetical protein
MTMFSKAAIAAALAVGAVTTVASSSFAQSFDPDLGTGNVVVAPAYVLRPEPRAQVAGAEAAVRRRDAAKFAAPKFARRRKGADAFAMAPGAQPSTDPNDPAMTSGGSLGYNRLLLVH